MADLSEMPGSTLVLDLVGHTAAAIQATEAGSGLEVVQPTVAAFEGNGADEALAVLTVLCLLELRLGRRVPAHPVPPPRFLEEWAARVLVGEEIQTLSHLQAFYRGCGEEGPFRFDGYWGNL